MGNFVLIVLCGLSVLFYNITEKYQDSPWAWLSGALYVLCALGAIMLLIGKCSS